MRAANLYASCLLRFTINFTPLCVPVLDFLEQKSTTHSTMRTSTRGSAWARAMPGIQNVKFEIHPSCLRQNTEAVPTRWGEPRHRQDEGRDPRDAKDTIGEIVCPSVRAS